MFNQGECLVSVLRRFQPTLEKGFQHARERWEPDEKLNGEPILEGLTATSESLSGGPVLGCGYRPLRKGGGSTKDLPHRQAFLRRQAISTPENKDPKQRTVVRFAP